MIYAYALHPYSMPVKQQKSSNEGKYDEQRVQLHEP
jgi:hypothetical protein